MTTKYIKIALFASLIVAMILPLSGMNTVTAETQKVDSTQLFEEFLKLAKQTEIIQSQIDVLEHEDRNSYEIDVLNAKLVRIQESMGDLQQQNIEAVKISPEEMQSLENRADALLKKLTNPNSKYYIDSTSTGYFINQIERNVHFTFEDKTPQFTENALTSIQKTGKIYNLDNTPFTMGFVEKNSHFINCSSRVLDCTYLMGGLAIKEGTETSSYGFSAKQTDNDLGFVTVAHGVNTLGASVKQYPSRIVGTVDIITSEATGQCDCAFVKVPSVTTVNRVYTGPSLTNNITSYATTGNPSVGTWLQMSGVGSEVKTGTYAGWHPTYQRMASYYTSVGGDSGAPVTTIGSDVKLYGMHTSNDSTYSYATPYNTIKNSLFLQ
ncbi:MAG TPA: hypothetical protein VIH04_04670 [Nitrosarchaeum sp.]